MTVKINLVGDGLSFEGETDIFSASQVIAFLNKGKPGFEDVSLRSRSDALPSLESMVPRSVVTPRQALSESEAKTNMEKIATFVKYLVDRDSSDSVTTQEIQTVFKKAGEPLPRNFTRDIKDTVVLGYIYETDTDGSYAISDGGIEAISTKFKNKVSVSKPKRNKPNSNAVKLRPEVKTLEVLPTAENIGDFNKLDTKGKKIVWLIAYADQKGIGGITPSEIQVLADKLREKITVSGFSSLTEKIINDSMIYKSGDGYKVTPKGLEMLKAESSS